MYKVINQSARSFIVKAEDVIKGGTKSQIKGEMVLVPGKSVVEVSDSLGKSLETYDGILIVEKPEKASKKGK